LGVTGVSSFAVTCRFLATARTLGMLSKVVLRKRFLMPPILAPAKTVLRRKSGEPISHQLYDAFEGYFPAPIETRLRQLNQTFPLKGLFSQIGTDEITMGQWMLYTENCFVGQVVNGGLEQFFDNCPGLIRDAAILLSEYAPREMSDRYAIAAETFIDVIKRHAQNNVDATGDALNPFWAELEDAWRDDDQDRFAVLEATCYKKDRNSDASNWFTQLERRVLDWVLDQPADFREVS
jgi:hypothetical protein